MLSTTPSRRATGFPGTHSQPPDHAVVPPNTGSFSTTTTRRPCTRAQIAAANPAAPDPITRTSMVAGVGTHLAAEDVVGPAGVGDDDRQEKQRADQQKRL